MNNPLIFDTDQGRILAHHDNDGRILLDIFTKLEDTRELHARPGREHLYPPQTVVSHITDADAWEELGRWLINAATLRKREAELGDDAPYIPSDDIPF